MNLVTQRVVSHILILALLVGLVAVPGLIRNVASAADPVFFTEEDFGKAYAKVLLSQVGKAYSDGTVAGAGYHVGDTSKATPYNPASLAGNSMYDCFGLALTCLMAMGYDYFIDDAGKTYYLKNGGEVFNSVRGIFWNHKTDDKVTLHHKNNEAYNVIFRLGKIQKTETLSLDDIQAGMLILNLPTAADATPPKEGPFSKNQIGEGRSAGINHCSVALFGMGKDAEDTITKENQSSFTEAQKSAILEKSWNNAYRKLSELFGTDVAKSVEGTTTKNLKGTSRVIPKMWDARGRGRMGATQTNYKTGFIDGFASFVFNTPYSNIWQVESISSGVSVDNNPFGKYSFTMSVYMIPVETRGTVAINKTDASTGKALSGARFDLYEWSVTQGDYIKSSNYNVEWDNMFMRYETVQVTNKDSKFIVVTSQNLGKIRIIETTPPEGYTNIDPKTGKPYQWDFTIEHDGSDHVFTVDAVNYATVGFNLLKKDYSSKKSLPGAVFSLYADENCTNPVKDLNGMSSFTTDGNGKAAIVFALRPGEQTYYLKETKAPAGYILSSDIYRITVSPAQNGLIVLAVKRNGASGFSNVVTIAAENAKKYASELTVENVPNTRVRIRKLVK